MTPKLLLLYVSESGREPFTEWIDGLKDRLGVARIRVRIQQLADEGHLGDVRTVASGVVELRFHFGPGYRVYIGQHTDTVVVLLCGGDKRTQDRDIANAERFWADWQENPERSSNL